MAKKLWIVGVYLCVIIILILYRDSVISWLDEGHALPLPVVILMTLFFAFFQAIPYGLVTGYLGNQYGWMFGGLISFLCTVGAAIMLFYLTRYVFEEQGRKFLEKYKPVDSFTKMVESNPFLAVLIGRLTLFLPSQVISVYSGLSSMSSMPYIIATILGKIPIVLFYSLAGDQLNQPYQLLKIGGIYVAFLLIVYGIYKYWSKRIEND